jgi:hypothetical protein
MNYDSSENAPAIKGYPPGLPHYKYGGGLILLEGDFLTGISLFFIAYK